MDNIKTYEGDRELKDLGYFALGIEEP